MTIVAPVATARNNSSIDASKLGDAKCSVREMGFTR
ncbi:hypothetical protein RERY_57390 [Rhodococcus erythropolis]|nr:hypothetical protein RERY_57390 [Rhodococcus erythropolis]